MKIETMLRSLALAAIFTAVTHATAAEHQVLATIGSMQVTSDELNEAMGSSPFSTQTTSLNEDDQAGLRGDMLRRLVAAKLLTLEAQRLGLDKTTAFQQDVEEFRLGLLYRFYMDKLRERVVIPADTLAAMKKQFHGDADGLTAAKAAYSSEQYKVLKLTTLQNMMKQDKTRLYEERIAKGIKPDTVLMEGNSFRITYGDIVDVKEYPSLPNPEWVKEQLYKRGELLLVAKVADKEGVDVSGKLKQYQAERLPAVMMDIKTKEWVPGEQIMQDWFAKHPEVAQIEERRHVGQLVVGTRKEAEELRERILKGESLFTLAGEYSIDPAGRNKNGDMGWITEGRGMPELEGALSKLEDGQISEVIQTKMGFHLLTILERKPKGQKTYAEVRDRIRQQIINENLRPYLGELEQRYRVEWKVIKARDENASQQQAK